MENRRQSILDAALDVFLEKGFDGATLAAIREKSGASTGSIYHFFSGKAEIAAALLTEATSGWAAQSSGGKAEAASPPDMADAEAAIKSSVEGFLRWGIASPKHFSFMDELLTRSNNSPDFHMVAEMLTEGRGAARALYDAWREQGKVRALSWDVAYALMMGPAYALLRAAAAGHAVTAADIALVSDAAWEAVRARAV
jgi:AcrR family transcriptional regulator